MVSNIKYRRKLLRDNDRINYIKSICSEIGERYGFDFDAIEPMEITSIFLLELHQDIRRDIVSLVEMPDPATLGDFIDDVEPYLPKDIPEADIALVINVHPDILFGLLPKLKAVGVKGIVGGSESRESCPWARERNWRRRQQS
jgi:hypothetical protein